MNLDLRKAHAAAANVIASPKQYGPATSKARDVIDAALPEIIVALAEQAEAERYEWAHAWLRAKAAEARA